MTGMTLTDSTPTSAPEGSNYTGPHWSHAQQRTWFLEQAYPGHAYLRVAMGVTIAGSLPDIATLRAALTRVFARHDVLHSGFGPDAQTVSAAPLLTIATLLETPGTAAHKSAIRRWITETVGAPLEAGRASLLHASLLCVSDDEYLLLLCAHRYVCDEEALALLIGDIAACLDGSLPAGPATPSFADFVAWQHPQQPALLAHWIERLTGAAPLLALPTDRIRPAIQGFAAASVPLDLPADLTARLRQLAHKPDLQGILLAAFAVLLQRHSGQSDPVIGLRSSYRDHPRFPRLVGPLDNTLALHLDISSATDTDALLRLVGEAIEDASTHADLPFERLIEALQPDRNLAYAPICQALFDYRAKAQTALRAGTATLRLFDVDPGTQAYDMTLRVDGCGDGLNARLIYNPGLFDEATIRRMAGHYVRLLEDMANDNPKPVSALRMLTGTEWRQLVDEWNATDGDYPTDSSLSRLFEAQADRSPDAPAVVGTGYSLSYRELEERSNRLARHLARLGVEHETLVGVAMERSPELFVAVLAIFKAGACYVPLDPGYPTQRLTAMLDDTAVRLLLTGARWLEMLPPHDARVLCLDRDWADIGAEPATRPLNPAGAGSAAYVVFTSGSTGRPKGVLVEQRQLLNRFAWMWREYPFIPGDVSACKTSINFVDSLWELLGPLLQGIPSVVVSRTSLLDPKAFVALLAEYRVSRMMLVPSLLRMMLDSHDNLAARLPLLREWCIGGEPLTVELARRFVRAMPGRLLLNLYGLSEAFDACFFDAGQLTDADILVPIGRPIANVQAYVLDAHRLPVPIGVIGELYVGGAGLARCYLGSPGLNAEKFTPNPFREEAGARLYRTGDLARYRPDGLIDYLGRADHQVKIRGFRIEPDEVAAVLRSHPDLARAVILARPDETGEIALAAYFVPGGATAPSPGTLKAWLRERLPDYMVPASYTLLAALPMTPSGKVDRLSLPAPDTRRPIVGTPYTAPADEIEQAIAAVWQDVLQLERVGSNDNFFDLGGTSLRMVQVNRHLCERMHRAIPVLQMYQHPTVRGLARSLATHSGPASSAAQSGQDRAAQRREMLARRTRKHSPP